MSAMIGSRLKYKKILGCIKLMSTLIPHSPIAALTVIELTAHHAQLLVIFFNENPEYFHAVQGEAAGPIEASEEITGELPSEISHARKLVIGRIQPVVATLEF
jgi:hypothetical protein